MTINYYAFRGSVALFFAYNSLTECRITMKFLHNFLDPEVHVHVWIALFTRVNSFVEVLINMVCELKNYFMVQKKKKKKKNCVKIPW